MLDLRVLEHAAEVSVLTECGGRRVSRAEGEGEHTCRAYE